MEGGVSGLGRTRDVAMNSKFCERRRRAAYLESDAVVGFARDFWVEES